MTSRRPWGIGVCCSVLLVLGSAGLSGAQDVGPDDYGTTETNYYVVSADEFHPQLPTTSQWFDAGAGGARYILGTSNHTLYANVRLPSGALITGMAILYEDSDADLGLGVRLGRNWWGSGFYGSEWISPPWSSSGAPGVTRTYIDINPDHTVEYGASPFSVQSYRLTATLDASYDVKLQGVVIYWNRQISPAPPTQTFPDVAPGYWAFQEIEALAASGITTGFPDGTYRPTDPVTRAQMATFLARALGLHWAP